MRSIIILLILLPYFAYAAGAEDVFCIDTYNYAKNNIHLHEAAKCSAIDEVTYGKKSRPHYIWNTIPRISISKLCSHDGLEYVLAFKAVENYYLGKYQTLLDTDQKSSFEYFASVSLDLNCGSYLY